MGKLLNRFILLLFTLLLFACTTGGAAEPNRSQAQLAIDNQQLTEPLHPPPNEPPAILHPTLPPPPITQLTTPLTSTCHFQPVTQRQFSLSTTGATVADFRAVPLEEALLGFGLVGWLPDDQRLLVTAGDTAVGHIATVDSRNGRVQSLANRIDLVSQPIWLEAAEAVLFVDVTESGWVLKLSGNPNKLLLHNLASAHITLHPQTQTATALLPNQAPVTVASDGQVWPLFQTEMPLNTAFPLSADDSDKLAWSGDGRWLAQYNRHQFWLFDTAVGQLCQLDLGSQAEVGQRWGLHAQWSADSRYLGIVTAVNEPDQLLRASELTIVDVQTGHMTVWHADTGGPFWHDFAWSPRDNTLVAKVAIGQTAGIWRDGLFFVDIGSGTMQRLLPDTDFYAGLIGQGIAWSADGKQLALTCPNGPLCLLAIRR